MNNRLVRLREKLYNNRRLRILFINDLGFQYGAGIAQFRQIQSLLLMGHEVAGLCWEGGKESNVTPTPVNADGIWLGMRNMNSNQKNPIEDTPYISRNILEYAIALNPDILIIGNLHYAKWSVEILLTLRDAGFILVAFMHDCSFVTGRCAYPGTCERFISGCDEHCPTADEYPALPRSQIGYAWELRKKLFCGHEAIPMAVNSRWTMEFARKALGGEVRHTDVVYYGLDENLFSPIDRSLSRRLLGIPQDDFIILFGAINISDHRKGLKIFKKIIPKLKRDVSFLVFGEKSLDLKNVNPTGLLRDFKKMPLLYSAANLFVATSLEEAFGQTIIEAAACRIPVIGFESGGIPEIVRHGENGILVQRKSNGALLNAIRFFMENPEACERFGAAGRRMVETSFTLQSQGERWIRYFHDIAFRLQ